MRKYSCLLFILIMSLFGKPIPAVAQLKVYQSNYLSLDSNLQHTSEKNVRLKILQAMVDDLLVFGAGILSTDQNKVFFEKKLTEFLLLQKEMGSKDLRAYVLWLAYRNYRISQKPDPRHSLDLVIELISEFDKQKKSIPNFLSGARGYFNDLNEQEARLAFYDKKVKDYTINNQKQNLAAALHGLAGYYSAKGDHNRAISYYELSADLYKDFLTYSYINQLGVIGRQYALWGNTVKAKSYIDSAINVKMRTGILIFTPEQSASELAMELKDYQKALSYCRKILQSDVSKTSIVITKVHMAICEANLNYVKEAQSHIQEAILLSDSVKMPIYGAQGALEFDYVKYLCARKQHNNPQAMQYLNLALQKFSDLKVTDLQKKYLKELLDFYTETRSYSQYYITSKRLDSLNKSIDLGLAPLKIASFETEQKEIKQKDSLNVLKEEKAIQQAVLNKNQVMLWASLMGILVISIAFYFVYRQSQINKKILANLRSTQGQLIQSEKMASLGELTAGIAHEIQNPLNFVNNFSEVNTELIDELQKELKAGNTDDAITISNDIKDNEQKINHHGKRADAIVKGMLQHSNNSSGVKEPTDINSLADEYLRLAYHGLRAKDKSFNATLQTDFDESIGKINIIPQDIGRVILNLITNAFYVVDEKKKTGIENYEPNVSVSTKKIADKILIRVKDNGNGIPQKVLDKIFQPFFTTKPTGQGTGLGLSLSYDIVKAHGGEIKVNTKINEGLSSEASGTEFTIQLPI